MPRVPVECSRIPAGLLPGCGSKRVAAAGSSVFTFTPSISAGATGTLTNPARVGGGGDPTNPTAPTPATAGACTGTGVPTEGCAMDGPDTVNVTDLTITKTSTSTFVVGSPASFVLTARNTLGSAATVGVVTVTDVLPAGLTYVSTGSGGVSWSCVNAGQTVTCTSSMVIAAGTSGNPITINVTVGSNAVLMA